jgi:hypothetical protein
MKTNVSKNEGDIEKKTALRQVLPNGTTVEGINESMQWWCEKCLGEGEIPFPYNDTQSVAVICSHCNTLSAYHWCSKCGFGGQIAVPGMEREPLYWVCQKCGTRYELPEGFYDNPIVFHPAAFAINRPISKYDLITVGWLKKAVLIWERYRLLNIIFIFAGLGVGLMTFLPQEIRSFGAVLMVILFPVQILFDIFTLIILSIFRGIYRRNIDQSSK